MSSPVNQILAAALSFGAAEASAYEPQILSAAQSAGIKAEAAVDLFVTSIKAPGGAAGGALALVLPAIKSELVSAINNAIATGATTEEKAIVDLVIAAAKNEAASLLK